MAFWKSCPVYVSGTIHKDFVPVLKVGPNLSKKYPNDLKLIFLERK